MNDIVVRLSPAAHVFVRPGPALQFGVDATRAGVIDGIDEEHTSGILRTLLRARTDITWSELSRSLVEAGLPRSVAETLLEELFDYRVLRPAPTGTQDVYVLGHSPLASIITSAFTTCGFRVYPLMSGETDEEFFLRCPADTPLILVDRMPHARRLSTPLVRRRGTFIPISLIDGRGTIGPLHINGAGPCPLCMDLHRMAVDEHWPTLLAQVAAAHTTHDPVVAHATAARLLSVVTTLQGTSYEPPGTPLLQFQPGDLLEVDPYRLDVTLMSYESHPSCPACWQMNN